MEERSEVALLGEREGGSIVTAGDEDGEEGDVADELGGALEEETRSTLMSTF